MPVAHSLSPKLFEHYCSEHNVTDCLYSLYPVEAALLQREALHRWVEQQGLLGFNVTIPYKRAIIPSLDALSDEARAIGAINCVVASHDNGRLLLTGHNTDATAFEQTLRPLLRENHKAALILGTGGAAQAVAYVLGKLGIDYKFVSRTPWQSPQQAISYSRAIEMADTHLLIVNATPLGMLPDVDSTPWPDSGLLTPRHLCYDLIYNPAPTRFLREAAAQGATTIGGMAMLKRQALLCYALWGLEKGHGYTSFCG